MIYGDDNSSFLLPYFWQVRREMNMGLQWNQPREKWDAWDPMLLSEGLFSAANIFSSLKLVYIFSVNPHLGPLQVSLSRMVLDILKFFVLDILVIFAFSCGEYSLFLFDNLKGYFNTLCMYYNIVGLTVDYIL